MVPTLPVHLTIQVEDDPTYVPDELAELAEDIRQYLRASDYKNLLACDTRLDIMSMTPPVQTESETAIAIIAQTDLAPDSPEVQRVLRALARMTEGFIRDCVNGKVCVPGGEAWVTL